MHRSDERGPVADDAERVVSRRSFIVRAGGAGMALSFASVLGACGDSSSSEPAAATSVVYADSGGTTRDASRAVFFDPFTKETGIKVVSADLDRARFELMSTRKRSQWDAAEFGAIDTIYLHGKGLLQQYPAAVPASDAVPQAYRRFQTGVFWGSLNLVYQADAFRGAQPSTWEDFWNVKKFPGRRAMRKIPTWLVESALLADGVPADKVLPHDFDRAFAKLDELRSHVTFVDTGAEVQQLVQNGDVQLAQLQCGRRYALEQEGVKLGMSWEQALHYGWLGPAMPHGAPHQDAMVQLAEFMGDAKRQAEFATATGYGPGNADALGLVDDKVLSRLPNTPEHLRQGFQYDFGKAADQAAEYAQRLTEWLANG